MRVQRPQRVVEVGEYLEPVELAFLRVVRDRSFPVRVCGSYDNDGYESLELVRVRYRMAAHLYVYV